MPTWGFSLFVVWLYALIFREPLPKLSSRPAAVTLMGVHILFLCAATWQRNQLYLNPIEMWEDVYIKYPDTYRNNYNLGNLYLEDSKFEKASELLLNAVRISPSSSEARNNLGVALMGRKEYDKAYQSFHEALGIKQNLAEAYYNLGRLHYLQKKYGEAEESFRQCLSLNPDYFTVHYELARLYHDLKNYKAALLELQQTLTYVPGNQAIMRKIEEVKKASADTYHLR